MRINALFLLALLILAACSRPAATQIFATETKPAVTTPAPTVEPSKMPEPTVIPDKYRNLKPETWEKCMQENVIETDADFVLFMKKVKEIKTINPDKVTEFSLLIPQNDTKNEKLPNFITILINNENGISFEACAAKKLPDGRKLPLFVISFKRPGSDIVGHLPVTKDPEAIKSWLTQVGRNYTYNESEAYKHIMDGSWKEVSINLIFFRGYAEQGGIWEDLLSLQPNLKLHTLKNNDYEFKITMFIGQRARDRNNNDVWVNIKDYGEEKFISELEKMILPAVSIGVIY